MTSFVVKGVKKKGFLACSGSIFLGEPDIRLLFITVEKVRNASKMCVEEAEHTFHPFQPRAMANTFPLMCILKQSMSGYFRSCLTL